MRSLIYKLIIILTLIGIQPQHTFAQTSGRVFWVAQQQAGASDANPGTSTQPWKTITRGLQDLQPGDTLMVRAGLYRERIHLPRGGTDAAHRITIEAAAGEKVVISGADILTAWTQDGNAWRHPWTLSLPSYGGDTDYLLRRELVVVDGAVLKPVAAREQLAPGTFFVAGSDTAPSALYVRLPNDAAPSGHTIEAATRQPLFSPASNAQCGDPAMPGWFRLSGFTFRHAANRAQWGAICPGGEGSLIENNTVEWTNGLGILANGRNHVFRGNQTNDNGHSGIGGSCNGCLVEGNQSLRNNWKGYSVWWDAGGGKWTRTENTTIRGHVARDNSGPGIWLDGYNRNNVIENSLVSANQVAGIMLELDSTGTLIRNNVVYGTRWLMWSGSGLLSQAASGNTIVHNSFIANAGDGLWIRADPDRRGADGNNRIYNNLFVRNNARGTAYEGYEIQIEGSTYGGQDALLNARSNRLDGNVYWHGSSASSSRTFYFQPDATRPDNFRSDDLVRWRELTQGDGQARIADPLLEDAGRPSGWHLRAGSPAIGQGVQPPVAVPVDLDQQVRPAVAADVGADQYTSTPHSLGIYSATPPISIDPLPPLVEGSPDPRSQAPPVACLAQQTLVPLSHPLSSFRSVHHTSSPGMTRFAELIPSVITII